MYFAFGHQGSSLDLERLRAGREENDVDGRHQCYASRGNRDSWMHASLPKEGPWIEIPRADRKILWAKYRLYLGGLVVLKAFKTT